MLNLLIISNSPKAQYITNVLQPMLKVIIDIVPDFDHGLKDVFEKRPATVCIQDQIAGVTGESVARHIQMLLGTGAPTFILMHENNSKAKPIKGLFEYVIDLNRPDAELETNFQDTLKKLLGEQWSRVYVPPSQNSDFVQAPTAVLQEAQEAQEAQENAERLVDDFLKDIETASFVEAETPVTGFRAASEAMAQKSAAASSVDEMAEMLLAQANLVRQNEIDSEVTAAAETGHDVLPIPSIEETLAVTREEFVAVEPIPDEHRCHVIPIQEKTAEPCQQAPLQPSAQKNSRNPSGPSPAMPPPASDLPEVSARKVRPVAKPAVPVTPIAPSDFRISRGRESAEEPIPEELLLAFEKNYRSKTTSMKRNSLILLVLFGLSGAGWYAVRQQPDLWSSLKARLMPDKPATVSKSTAAVRPLRPRAQAAPANAVPVLPSFIPQEGHDSAYAARNPGWDRYLAKNHEIRIFKAGSTLKAVQVLSVEGRELPDSVLTAVLKELVGTSDYQVNSREIKSGVLVLRGTIAPKADLLIYKKNSSLRAFVVSLN